MFIYFINPITAHKLSLTVNFLCENLIGLDFSVLDASINFYVVNVNIMNDCTEKFKVGGTVPLTGDAFYTVVKK